MKAWFQVFLALLAIPFCGGSTRADEPSSIYDRWQALEVAAGEELRKYPAPPHLFADEEGYRKYVKESGAAGVASRRQMLAKFKDLLAEGTALSGDISFDDHLALAVMAATLQQYPEALRHAMAADLAQPDDPRVLLALIVAQLGSREVDAAEKTLERVAVAASLPHVNWTRSFLNQAHNLFRQERRWNSVSRSERWLLDVKRAGKMETALDCNSPFVTIDLATGSAARDSWGELALEDLDREQRAWEALDNPYAPWIAAKLFARKILLLSKLGKKDDARAVLEQALTDSRHARAQSPEDANACLRLIALERTQFDLLPPDAQPAARKHYIESLHAAIRQFPVDSMAIDFGQGVGREIFALIREGEYETAITAKGDLLETLRGLPRELQTSPAMVFVYRMAYMPNEEIERGLRRNQLVGTPAPPFEVDAWANGSPLSPDDLRGKVVLVDFWAVWCGPCVQAFPKLIQWHGQYSDKGLVTIGVTKYYSFGWDAENSRCVRTEGITPADEQAAVGKFAKHHGLPYNLAFDAEDGRLSSRFGVEGIPQVVLVDRQGIVRLVRVGTSKENAEVIAKTIEMLLAE
jgi:thiol-disulfide isomerase/thioredoxin